MKLFTLIAIAAIFISSCKTPTYYMGMSESDFTTVNRKAYPIVQNEYTSVYRLEFRLGSIRQYYHFRNGKLVSMDNGGYRPDAVIEVRSVR